MKAVYLRSDQLSSLRIMRKRTGRPVAELIREGVDAVLEQERKAGNLSEKRKR